MNTIWIISSVMYLLMNVEPKIENEPSSMTSYLHLISHSRFPQGYTYYTRTGFQSGFLGSEHVPVVLPAKFAPGYSWLVPWYTLKRGDWLKSVLQISKDKIKLMDKTCILGMRSWLRCAFRMTHFMFQSEKISAIKQANSLSIRRILKHTLLQPVAFRLNYVVFYCQLRRVLRAKEFIAIPFILKELFHVQIDPDIYGLCPRVCSDRSGMRVEDEDNEEYDGALNISAKMLVRPEKRLDQCVPPIGRPTSRTSKCIPSNEVGLVTLRSFVCECPKSEQYHWLCQEKICSHHSDWRMPNYWGKEVNKTIMWRFNPPEYYEKLPCNRTGTRGIGYLGLDEDTSETGYVKPYLRRAEYCICKNEFYGSKCDKKKDPCEMSAISSLSGNVACRVSVGNRCLPNLASSTYICECLPNYRYFEFTYGPLQNQDNCMEHLDVCKTTKCLHGRCLSISSTPDFDSAEQTSSARCLCFHGWTGRFCNRPLSANSWSSWTSWSICEPSCQDTSANGNTKLQRDRFRVRRRRCLNLQGDCQFSVLQSNTHQLSDGQTVEQKRICRPRVCDRFLQSTITSDSTNSDSISSGYMMELISQAIGILDWLTSAITISIPLVCILVYWSVHLQNRRMQMDE